MTEHFTSLLSRNSSKGVFERRTTSEGGYFVSLGICLFNRVGKRVSVRTRKRRKVLLAFKLLFLLFFHCINSVQEKRPSASELLETDDFVKVPLSLTE